MDSLIKIVAKFFIIIPAVVALVFIYKLESNQKRKASLIHLILLAGLALAFAFIGQHIYTNPRPPYKDGATPLFPPSDYNGFPSDHTLFTSAIGFWLLKYKRRLGLAMIGLAILIGWARVAAHVHHAIDIAGAIAMVLLAYVVANYALGRRELK